MLESGDENKWACGECQELLGLFTLRRQCRWGAGLRGVPTPDDINITPCLALSHRDTWSLTPEHAAVVRSCERRFCLSHAMHYGEAPWLGPGTHAFCHVCRARMQGRATDEVGRMDGHGRTHVYVYRLRPWHVRVRVRGDGELWGTRGSGGVCVGVWVATHV
jgi:hypothetical protein